MGRMLVGAIAVCTGAMLIAGCGESFTTGGSTSATSGTGASGQGGSGTAVGGGGPGGAGGNTGAGGDGGASVKCLAGSSMQGTITLHTTLDDIASITAPEVGDGDGATIVTTPQSDFVEALDGNGIHIDADDESVSFSQKVGGTVNFNPQEGTVDFCFRPEWDHDDGVDHVLMLASVPTTPAGRFVLRKAGSSNGNSFLVVANNGSTSYEYAVDAATYELKADVWYRVTVSWEYSTATSDVHLYIDGNEQNGSFVTGVPLQFPGAGNNQSLILGAFGSVGQPFASGVLDEFYVFDAPIVP